MVKQVAQKPATKMKSAALSKKTVKAVMKASVLKSREKSENEDKNEKKKVKKSDAKTTTTTTTSERRVNPFQNSGKNHARREKANVTLTMKKGISNQETKPTKSITELMKEKQPGVLPITTEIRLGAPPVNWQQTYNLIRELREKGSAPVDTIGCHELASKGPHYVYQTLLCAMLSSQTRDQATAMAINNLKMLDGGCTIETISKLEESALANEIRMVGFARTKAKHIKETTEIIKKNGGKVPDTIKKLIELPGVGMKMAQLVMSCGHMQVVGICVDVHVHKICNKLRWVCTSNAEQTRQFLESWLPKGCWSEINPLFVGLGQMMQQQKKQLLLECLDCSRPIQALKLIDGLGYDFRTFKDGPRTLLTFAEAKRLPKVCAFLRGELS